MMMTSEVLNLFGRRVGYLINCVFPWIYPRTSPTLNVIIMLEIRNFHI